MNVVRGNTRSRAPNTILINVHLDTRLRARQHAVKHQGTDFYQLIENNFDYFIVGIHYSADSEFQRVEK